MCVLAFAWAAHPRWRIVLAGNRDEHHDRPAAALARWPDGTLAGRDLRSGGTWLGVAERGGLAVVTNLRGHGAAEPTRPSRGALVADLLAGADPDAVAPDAYNPFNLIVADATRARFVSNRPAVTRCDLAPGLYGLSNGTLDEPWSKTLRLKAALADWLADDAAPPEALFAPLRDDTREAGGDALSAVFVCDPVYGTRCSTVVAVDAAGAGTIVERRYDAKGDAAGDTALAFNWPARD